MRKLIFLLSTFITSVAVEAQNLWSLPVDSMKAALTNAKDDESRLISLNNLFFRYAWLNPDSASLYAQQYMIIAQRLGSDRILHKAYNKYQMLAGLTGNYPQALEYGFKSLSLAEKTKDFLGTVIANFSIGGDYLAQRDISRAIYYTRKGKAILDADYTLPSEKPSKSNDTLNIYASNSYELCKVYLEANQPDSVLQYINLTEWLWGYQWEENGIRWPTIPFMHGNVLFQKGEYATANNFYHEGIISANYWKLDKDLMDVLNSLAHSHEKLHQLDSAIYYSREVLRVGETARNQIVKLEALTLLANAFKAKNNVDSMAKYFELAFAAKDDLFNQSKQIQMQNSTFNEQMRRQEIENAEKQKRFRFQVYALATGTLLMVIISIMLYRNNKHKQKAKIKIERAYDDLKATQQQLIQSEKMASLGELTAGIAHEIQNPLNFVNNFSDVNTELIDEAGLEINNGNIDEVKTILHDIKENEQKINHHGKRADAIVKGMLQHSRSSTGQKEPTDINALADEYLRLAYHGLRAKDKTFDATIKTEFDNSIGKVNIIPQDIGRVLLNLINNAFYAVHEKKRSIPHIPQGERRGGSFDYEPAVTVTTKRTEYPLKDRGNIEIRVRDNGNGIPEKILDKIFQPFFTTKPTGQGTGLGLSLSYDIIKAHGGELKVETRQGEFSEFIIGLPLE